MGYTLSQKFNTFTLLKFALPTIIMMIFMSMYSMVDGIFVSNFIGENALSGMNIVFPFVGVVLGVGIMLSTGGSAIIAKSLGEGNDDHARNTLSLIYVVGTIFGFVFTGICLIFTEEIITLLGSTEQLHEYTFPYFRFMALIAPFSFWQIFAQGFFVTAGRPDIGLISTAIGGVVNIIFDYVFIVICDMGIIGAALGTGLGCLVPGILSIVFFMRNKKGGLYFVKPKWDGKTLLSTCGNGSSEMVTNISSSVTTLLFNIAMLKLVGEDGVAAITIIFYVQFFQMAIYLGFSSGVAPVFSFNYGEGDIVQIKKAFKTSIWFISLCSFVIVAAAMAVPDLFIRIFVKETSNVYAIAREGFLIFSTAYLFMGLNVFASSMFTAFGNGKVSALISFLRTFVFIVSTILILPQIIGIFGVWIAVPAAEFLTFFMSLWYIFKLRKKYNYL